MLTLILSRYSSISLWSVLPRCVCSTAYQVNTIPQHGALRFLIGSVDNPQIGNHNSTSSLLDSTKIWLLRFLKLVHPTKRQKKKQCYISEFKNSYTKNSNVKKIKKNFKVLWRNFNNPPKISLNLSQNIFQIFLEFSRNFAKISSQFPSKFHKISLNFL